jgi:hypothetical protein
MYRWKGKKFSALVVSLLLVMFVTTGCGRTGEQQQASHEASSGKLTLAAEFAPYQEVPVSVQPAVKAYQAAADLSNISNRDRFEFSSAAQKCLTENGFVVVPGLHPEFFELYEANRYDYVPSLVTTDAMLHNYHLFFNHLLKSVEKEQLIPELKQLNPAMLTASIEQYENLKGTAWENAARRNIAFFAVASQLLEPAGNIPASVSEVVNQELNLISQHAGIAISPVMSLGVTSPDVLEDLKEDYTQYIPRGHYTGSDELKNYFKTMMWYGRMTFRVKNEDETRSAVLMTLALNQGDNFQRWERIYQPTSFFVGRSDDLGYNQYSALLTEVYGSAVKLSQVADNQEQWTRFLEKVKELEPPAINSIPIFDATIQPDREREIKGFRFMGQRFTLDASIFQRLVYREVGENSQGERRLLPKGLDIPAAMGSTAAYSLLQQMGETDYANYPENMTKMRRHIAGLDQNTWTQNLYWNWLYTLLPLTVEKPEGYPSFMRNQAWAHKELNTYLSSWTELKHDTILYAKQVYAEMGGGGGAEKPDDRGYVEPNPELYARLAALTTMTREGLASRGLLSERDQASLERMAELALSLKTISEKELSNTPLSTEEYDLIRTFGGQLEHFWLEALREENVVSRSQIWENPAPVVADVATAPPDLVLEEGTGYISPIYAVVPVEGQLRIARGGVYTYYEFPWPAKDRLTDRKWQEMLQANESSNQASNQAPKQPDWTKSYTAEGPCRYISAWELENKE